MTGTGGIRPGPQVPTVRLVLSPGDGLAKGLGAPLLDAAANGSLGGELRGLPAAAMGLAAGAIGDAVARLAEIDLRGVLLDGWRIHREIVAAAEETARDPEARKPVTILTHRVTATHRPTIDVYADEHLLATLHVELRAVLTVDGLVATIVGGRLVSVGVGGTRATAVLSVEGVEIASRTEQLDLSAGIPLGSGIQLVAPPSDR